MALNLATLNEGFKQVCACLLSELKNLSVKVAAMQVTHFICDVDCRVLESDFNVFSAYGCRTSVGVYMLVGRSLDADVDVVFEGDRDRLVVAEVAIKSFKFWLGVVNAPNFAAERASFLVGGHRSWTIQSS